jgi:ADYC domain
MNTPFLYLAVLGTASMAACMASEDPGAEAETSQDMISLNGTSLTGIALAGTTPTGSSLANTTVNGISVSGLSQTGTAITATSTTTAPWSGAGIVGSTWTATASNGAAVKLRVDSALQGTAPNADAWFYGVSYQTSTAWSPLCGLDGAGHPVLAVAVAGVWSATTSDGARYGASSAKFTLGCRAKTIAKCVELGYKTYKGYATQLASCVRLLRGDYCGTGASYTVDGTTLNLYDNVGVLTDNQAWAAEAEWTPTGASCINSNNSARYELVLTRDPKCVPRLKTATCGASFASGAILIDELSP